MLIPNYDEQTNLYHRLEYLTRYLEGGHFDPKKLGVIHHLNNN